MSSRGGDRPGNAGAAARKASKPAAPLVTPAPAIAGPHRASARGQVNPQERPPAWAMRSPAAFTAWRIARYGLPGNMMAHERPVLILSLQQMLREPLSSHVRTRVRSALRALGVSPADMPSGPSRTTHGA
jgi:hypothetical protein